jgi:hypothetical protein
MISLKIVSHRILSNPDDIKHSKLKTKNRNEDYITTYPHFIEHAASISHPEDESNTFLLNVGTHVPSSMA